MYNHNINILQYEEINILDFESRRYATLKHLKI